MAIADQAATQQRTTNTQPVAVCVGKAEIAYFADPATKIVERAELTFTPLDNGAAAEPWKAEIVPEGGAYAMNSPDGSTVHNGRSVWDMLQRGLRQAQDRFLSGVL